MSEKNGSSGGKPDVEQLRAEIRRTRADLGETVQALAAKADVKARAKEQVEHTKQRVRAQAAEAAERVREAAQSATGRVRGVAAGDRSEQNGGPLTGRARIPVAAALVAAVAVVGVILIVRGRRR